jgi:Fe-S cluster biogenesis protein NfuA
VSAENSALDGRLLASHRQFRRNPEYSAEKPESAFGTHVALPFLAVLRSGGDIMVTRENVESVLLRIRPFLVADGGDIGLVDIQGNSATVRLTGACAGCPTAHITLHRGVEMALRDAMPDFGVLRLA